MTKSLFPSLRELAARPSISPRPWELIFDRGMGRGFTDGRSVANVIQPNTIRIVDSNNCLLVHIKAAPEQTIRAEDMQFIVEAINSIPDLLHQIDGLDSVRRCNDPMPRGGGLNLCDLYPDHDGPHVNAATSSEWRNRA